MNCDLGDFACETVYTVAKTFRTIVIHRSVDLVADEQREHVVSEDLAQAQVQGQIRHRLPGPGQLIKALPIPER